MNLDVLKRIVQQGETTLIEFKRRVTDANKVAKEMVAFANTKGGMLLIGVNDEGTISGLKDIKENQFVLHQIIDKRCVPTIDYETEIVPVNQKKSVLIYKINEAEKKPIRLMDDDRLLQGKVYYRIKDRSIQASKELRQILKFRSQNTSKAMAVGDLEQQLLKCFNTYEEITLSIFRREANIPEFLASKILINLASMNLIEIIPEEGKEDRYIQIQ